MNNSMQFEPMVGVSIQPEPHAEPSPSEEVAAEMGMSLMLSAIGIPHFLAHSIEAAQHLGKEMQPAENIQKVAANPGAVRPDDALRPTPRFSPRMN